MAPTRDDLRDALRAKLRAMIKCRSQSRGAGFGVVAIRSESDYLDRVAASRVEHAAMQAFADATGGVLIDTRTGRGLKN